MKTLSILLLSAVCACGQSTWRNVAFVGSLTTSASAGGSCSGSATYSTDGTSTDYLGYSGTYHFVGQSGYSQTTNHQICKVSFKLSKSAGDISGLTYCVKIYPMASTSLDIANIVATSTGVTGNNSWNGTSVEFTFSTPVSLTANTVYGIVVEPSADSSANYVEAFYTASGGTVPGGYVRWNGSGAAQVAMSDAKDCACAIFFYQ